jgi:hypothetical protein
MKLIKAFFASAGVGLLFMLLTALPVAAAPTGGDPNWTTPLTISEPTEIPGKILLPGKYEVQVLNTKETRMVVQFKTVDPPKVVATVIAVPDYRVGAAEGGGFNYFQRAPGSGLALKSWLYPGNNFGVEFVYPKEEAVQLAQASHQEVYAAPSAKPEANEPVVMVTPELKEVPIKEYNLPETKVAEAETKPLPHTASNLPILALLGFGAILAAATLRAWTALSGSVR